MKHLCLLSIFLLINLTLFAQNYAIKGRVTNGSVNLSQATLTLKNSTDGTIIRGTYTNTEGAYSFTDIKVKDVTLLVSLAGYKPQVRKLAATGDSTLNINFHLLADTILLKEVSIAVKRPFLTKNLDKTVINIENSVYQKGETGFSLFNVIPGIVADNMGINYGGQRAVQVYVDDKKIYLQGEDLIRYLKSIPSEDIKTYEMRTVSGADYEGNSTGVLINITLKRNSKYGLSGNFSTSFEQNKYGSINSGLLINYKTGKFNFKTNYTHITGRGFSNDYQDQYYFDTGIHSRQENKFNGKFVHYNYFSFGTDYDISANQLVSFDYQITSLNSASVTAAKNSTMSDFTTSKIDSFFVTNNNKDTRLQNQQVNFLYRLKLDSLGSKIDADYSYVGYRNTSKSSLINDFFYGDGTKIRNSESLHFNNPQKVDLSTASINLKKIVAHNVFLQVGSKYNFSKTNNEIKYFNGFYPDQSFDTKKSNTFSYHEKIIGFYGLISKESNKWSFKAGLRAEYTDYNGESLSYLQNDSPKNFIKNKRWDFFPSLFIQDKLNQDNSLSFAYSRKITRPSYSALNPFEDVSDPYNISRGNPYLNPYFTHSLELNYTNQSKHNFTLFYTNTANMINPSYSTEDRVVIESYGNLNDEQKLGLSMSTSFKLAKWWEIVPYTSITYGRIYVFDKDKVYSKYTPYVSASSRFTLPKGYFAEVNGFYIANNFFSVYDLRPQGRINFVFKKSFFKDKLTSTLNLNDPFNLTRIGYDVNEVNFRRNIRRELMTRSVSIGFSYNFSKGKKKTESVSKDANNDEVKGRL